MNGGTLCHVLALGTLFLAFNGLAKGGFGWRVRYYTVEIIFWLIVTIGLLFLGADPHIRFSHVTLPSLVW